MTLIQVLFYLFLARRLHVTFPSLSLFPPATDSQANAPTIWVRLPQACSILQPILKYHARLQVGSKKIIKWFQGKLLHTVYCICIRLFVTVCCFYLLIIDGGVWNDGNGYFALLIRFTNVFHGWHIHHLYIWCYTLDKKSKY